ncbi:MAG: hypothetical protein A2Z83_02855 [Omnitrophica bacterium GWA2_52_8]|nr:MAG: hypothetical protein A2Z83_02855 [Omnitrophica bacterium GWA2_52_8]
MKNQQEEFENQALSSYREYLKQEFAQADLTGQKKAFIHECFARESWLASLGELGIPAMAFALLCLTFAHFYGDFSVAGSVHPMLGAVPQADVRSAAEREPVSQPASAEPRSTVAAEKQNKELPAIPAVDVRRVVSHAGPVVVYQKSFQDHPITVIWVFPRG